MKLSFLYINQMNKTKGNKIQDLKYNKYFFLFD